MPKYLSGRAKLTSRYTEDRRKYLNLNQAEPSLAVPLSPIGDEGNMPTGDIMQVVSVYGDPDPTNRYWIPFGGGVIPGAITVFEEGVIVGGPSSTTQLDFRGNLVTAIGDNTGLPDPGIAVTVTIAPLGNDHELMFNDNGEFGATSFFVYDNSTVGIASVGIGTSTPSTNLHIVGSTRIEETIYDYNNDPGSVSNILTKGAYGIEWAAAGAVQSGAGGTFYEVQYHGTAGLVDGAPNFVWRGDKVGIGSTLPTRTLDVFGNTRFIGVNTFSQLNPDNLYAGISTFVNNVKFDGATKGKDILWSRSSSILELQDHVILGIGTDSDLQLSHDGSVSKIDGGSSYPLQILADEFVAKNAGSTKTSISAFDNGVVELFYAGAKKLSTVNNGVRIYGSIIAEVFDADNFEANNANISGITTTGTLLSNYSVLGFATATQLKVAGVVTTTDLQVNGIGTIGKLEVDNLTFDGNDINTIAGNLNISAEGTSAIDINNITIIDNTDDSSYAALTGALRIKGGASVSKRLFVGDDLTVSGVTTLASAGGTTTTGGNMYVNGNLYVSQDVVNDGISGRIIDATQMLRTKHFEATGVSTVGIFTATDVGVGGSITVAGISTFVGIVSNFSNVYFSNSTSGLTSAYWKQSSAEFIFKTNSKVVFEDDDSSEGSNLEIYHNGNNSYIHAVNNQETIEETGTGALIYKSDRHSFRNSADTEQIAMFNSGGSVEIYHSDTKRLETTGFGVTVLGKLKVSGLTTTQNLFVTGITTLANNGGITTVGGDLYVKGDLFVNDDIGYDEGTMNTLIVATKGTFKGDVEFWGADNANGALWDKDGDTIGALYIYDDHKIIFGQTTELSIHHSTTDTHNYIKSSNPSGASGDLYLTTPTSIGIGNGDLSEIIAGFNVGSGVGAGVTLYHNNVKRLITSAEGVLVSGGITARGISIGSTPWNEGTGNGDIVSDGGDDAFFGIYNKASHDHGRISLMPTSASGVSTSLLDVQVGTGITAHGHILPIRANEYELGSLERKWNKVWTKDISIDGLINNTAGQFEWLKVTGFTTTAALESGISTFTNTVNVYANLGIGTDNPSSLGGQDKVSQFVVYFDGDTDDRKGGLEINGNTNNTGDKHGARILSYNRNSTVGFRRLRFQASEYQIELPQDGNSTLYSVPRINITGIGSVGIGSTQPQQMLDVSGNVVIGRRQVTGNPGTTVGIVTIRGHHVDTNNEYAQLYLANSESSGGSTASIRAGREGDNYGTNLTFWTNSTGSAGNGSERLRIDKDGHLVPGDPNNNNETFDLGGENNRWRTLYASDINLSSGNISLGKGIFTFLKVTGVGTFGKSDDTTYSGISSQRDEKDLDIINESEVTDSFTSLNFINGTNNQGDISVNSIKNSSNFKSELAIKQRTAKETWHEVIRISSDGDVGIGTNNPSCKLAIQDTATHTAYANAAPSVGDCMLQLYNNPSSEAINNHATIQFGVKSTEETNYNRVNTISAVAEAADNRKMATTFCTDDASSRTEKMRISGDGKVLIGTTTEGYDDADDLTIAGVAHAGITVRSGSTSLGTIAFSNTTSGTSEYNGYVQYNHDNNTLFFGIGSNERLSIDSTGHTVPGTTDGSQDLGSDSNRWGTIYGNNLNIQDGSVDAQSVTLQYLKVDRVNDDNVLSGISTLEGNVNVGVGSTTAVIDVNKGKLYLRDGYKQGAIDDNLPSSILEASTSKGSSIILARDDHDINNANVIGSINFYGTNTGTAWRESANIECLSDSDWDTNTPSRLVFSTAQTSLCKERLRISPIGYVGISRDGVTPADPDALLHLVSNKNEQYVTDATDGQLTKGTTLFLQNKGTSNNQLVQIAMQSKSTGEYNRIVSSGGDDPYMAFGVNNKERVRFANDGDVSIGYAGDPSDGDALSSNTALLGVGKIKCKEINIIDGDAQFDATRLSVQWLNVTGFTTTAALEVSTGIATFKAAASIPGNNKLYIGDITAADAGDYSKLEIYHASDNNSYIDNLANNLYVRTPNAGNISFGDLDGTVDLLILRDDDDKRSVELSYNGSTKFSTENHGINVGGDINLTGSASNDITSNGGGSGGSGIFGIFNSYKKTGSITFNLKNNNNVWNEALKIHPWNEDGQSITDGQTKSWFDFRGELRPTATEVYDLGHQSNKWNTVWAKTFNGAFQGNADTADSAGYAEYAKTIWTLSKKDVETTYNLTFVEGDNEADPEAESVYTDDVLKYTPSSGELDTTILDCDKIRATSGGLGGENKILGTDSNGKIEWITKPSSGDSYELDADGDANSYTFKLDKNSGDGNAGTVTISKGSGVSFSGVTKEGFTLDVDTSAFGGSIPIGGIIMWTQSSTPTGWVRCDNSAAARAAGAPDLRDRFIVGAGNVYGVNSKGGYDDAQLPSHSHDMEDHQHDFSFQPSGSVDKESHSHNFSGSTNTGDVNANHTHNFSNMHSEGSHRHGVYATHTDGGDATRYGWPSLKGPDSRDHFQRYHKPDQNTAQLRNWNGVNGIWMEPNGSHKHDGSTGNQSRGHTHKMNIGSASGGSHKHDITFTSKKGTTDKVSNSNHDTGSEGTNRTRGNNPKYYAVYYIMRVS